MQENWLQQKIKSSPLLSVTLFSLVAFILGLLVFWAFLSTPYVAKKYGTLRGLRLNQDDYPLVNPLLLCNVDQKDFNQDKKLGALVTTFVSSKVQAGKAKDMSVYLINYGNGKWVGVNENERYDPASLLKVPLMIAYFKSAESNPGILSEKTSYNGDDQNEGEYFKSNNTIVPGKTYQIKELMQSMISHSDNTASVLLELYTDKNSLYDVYTDLGLPMPADAPNVEYLSAKLYAYFFRVLYNGTYLDKKYSEEALEYLTDTTVSAIRDGVPEGVKVAQKFGERTIYEGKELKDREFHDCDIVYKPGNPYLLCVMSRGWDFDTLHTNVSELSTLVYKNINK